MRLKNNKGFTLVETMIGVSMFFTIIATAISSYNQLSKASQRAVNYMESDIQTGLVFNILEEQIINSNGIKYSETSLDGELDTITLYKNKRGTSTVKIGVDRSKPKQSRIYFEDDSGDRKYYMTNEFYVRKFDIKIPNNPYVNTNLREIQPYVEITVSGEVRKFNQVNPKIKPRERTRGRTIRNYVYSNIGK